jgi:hypothetical protein
MPITQSRLYALLLAAESCATRHENLTHTLRRALNDSAVINAADTLNTIAAMLTNTDLMLDSNAVARLAAERTHYNLTSRRNRTAAARARISRGLDDPLTPRLQHTPYDRGELASLARPIPPVHPRAARSARAPSSEDEWHLDDDQDDVYVEPSVDVINKAIALVDAPPKPDPTQPVIAVPDDEGKDS